MFIRAEEHRQGSKLSSDLALAEQQDGWVGVAAL